MMRPIILYVFLMSAIFQYGEASEALTSHFVASFSCSGEPLCATDVPTQELPATSLVSCGILCLTTPHCLQFDYIKMLSMCQLYDFVPSSFAAIDNCIRYAPLWTQNASLVCCNNCVITLRRARYNIYIKPHNF